MTEQLSGRELDKAIAEALGWEDASWTSQIGMGNIECWKLPDGTFRSPDKAKFHASVDALREVEPKCVDISVCSTHGDGPTWCCTIWERIVCDGYMDYEIAAQGDGSTEPEARARALLAWIKRNQE